MEETSQLTLTHGERGGGGKDERKGREERITAGRRREGEIFNDKHSGFLAWLIAPFSFSTLPFRAIYLHALLLFFSCVKKHKCFFLRVKGVVIEKKKKKG